MNLNRRLAALEKVSSDREEITLTMPDGRTEILQGRGDYVRELLKCAFRGERTPDMVLLSESIGSTEPGGGRLLDLARAVFNSPREGPDVKPGDIRIPL